MRDNELIQVFLPIINDGLTAQGFTDVTVRQSYQPTQQGASSGPSVYFYKLYDRRYGFLKRENIFNADDHVMEHIETQFYETTFQVAAWSIQDPSDIDSVTASDLANIVAGIMQSDSARLTLADNDIGILRVTDVTNPYFVDDKGRNEASPSFDFTLTHRQVVVTEENILQSVEVDVYEV